MATRRPAFGRPITANILTQDETAQPGNAPATRSKPIATRSKLIATSGNPPATVGNPIATPGEALADLGEALANPENPLAAFGIGPVHGFPLLRIHLPP